MTTPFDSHDMKILCELQSDGRISNQALAENVGLSAAACWRRVKALEERGVIEGYTALINPKTAGFGLCVLLMVQLTRHNNEVAEQFERAVRDWPEVRQSYALSGSADYFLRVIVADMESYDRFLKEKFFNLNGVSHVTSNFTLHAIKNESGVPL